MINYRNIRTGKTCVVWTRVSTKYQEENGGSLKTQKEICDDYAQRMGYNIVGYYGGKHESAKTPGKMIKGMYDVVRKNSNIAVILVSEFDRFSRCGWQASKMLDEMREIGIVVVAAKYGLDTRTKEGMLMAKNTVNMADWDNQNRTDKFVDGKTGCMLSGAWSQKAPLGYYKVGKSREAWCYLNNDGKLIREAFKWKLEGISNSEIIEKLSACGLEISKQTLHKVLTNPFYAGKICNKQTNSEMIDGQIEPAISYTDYIKVQHILSGRTGKYTHNKVKPNLPLTKHVICEKDGTPFTSYTKTKTTKKACHSYDYYKCNKAGCKTNVSAKEMHLKYEAMLGRYNLSEDFLANFSGLLHAIIKEYSEDILRKATLFKKNISEIDNDIKAAQLRFATGKIDKDTFDTAMTEYRSRKDVILVELDKCNLNLSNLEKKIPIIITTASNLSILWHNADLETKRKIQNLVFPRGILWSDEIGDYRTTSVNSFFDVLDKYSISYGIKKGATSDEVVPLCG